MVVNCALRIQRIGCTWRRIEGGTRKPVLDLSETNGGPAKKDDGRRRARRRLMVCRAQERREAVNRGIEYESEGAIATVKQEKLSDSDVRRQDKKNNCRFR